MIKYDWGTDVSHTVQDIGQEMLLILTKCLLTRTAYGVLAVVGSSIPHMQMIILRRDQTLFQSSAVTPKRAAMRKNMSNINLKVADIYLVKSQLFLLYLVFG